MSKEKQALQKQMLGFYQDLNITDEAVQSQLQKVVTGKQTLADMTLAELKLLIELLTDLLDKSEDEQRLTVNILLDKQY